MSKIEMIVVFLACCAAVVFAQNNADTPTQAPATRPQTVSVSAAVMAGLVDHKTLPQYPEEAMTKGIQGDIVFKIVVDESGNIVRSEPAAGDPLLIEASADAIRNYHFRPYLLNGSAVRVESRLGFHFTLARKGDSTEGLVECMSTIP